MSKDNVKDYRFIVYARFTSEDKNYYPCLCEKISKSQLMKDTLLLHNVYALQDRVYQSFKMNKLYVRTENIMYICEGKIDLNNIDITEEQDLIEDELVTEEKED